MKATHYILVSIIILAILITIPFITNTINTGENNKDAYNSSTTSISATTTSTTTSSSTPTSTRTLIGIINTIGSPKDLPPYWGSVIIKVYRQHLVARPGEILKVPVKLTYIAGPQAPQKAVLLLGVKPDGMYYTYIPTYYVDLDKLYSSKHLIILMCNTTDFDRIHNKTIRKIMLNIMELHSFNKDKVPVLIVTRNGKPYLIAMRSNDLVWYNVTRLVLRANQTVVVTMYIWIPSFIKPGYVFNGANIVGTDNIVSETPHVVIWPVSIKEIIVKG
ncbi:MAG: hypothetical protein GXO43_08390 [Crenarchaeota archaeon]|nr:hypothetical protein [Thermoproteota archaeon]